MSRRAVVLLFTMCSVLLVAACGRASQDDINDILGIQPTPTLSDEQITQSTEVALAAASAEAAGATPVLASSGGFDASVGDVKLGRQQFAFQCQQCHRVDGQGKGPALSGADNPAIALSDDEIATLVRDGHGEAAAYSIVRLSDKQLASIIAFIRQQSQ